MLLDVEAVRQYHPARSGGTLRPPVALVAPAAFAAQEVSVRGHVTRCRATIATSALGRLLVPQGISQAGDAITLLLLAQLVVVGGDGASAGQLLQAIVAAVVPIVTVGPFAGMVADRWPRRRTMIVGHIGRAVVTAAAMLVPITGERWIGYAAVGALLAVTRLLYTTRAAVLPRLVPREQLVAGDSLVLMVGMLAGLLGGAVGSLASWTVPEAGFALAAFGHLYAASLYRALPADLGGGRGGSAAERRDGDASGSAGWRVAARDLRERTVAVTIVATMVYRALVGAALATVVQIVDARYDAGAPGYAATLGLASVGSFAGTLTPGRFVALAPRARAAGSCLLAAAACAIAAMFTDPIVGLAAIALVSFGFQNLRVVADATVQGAAHDAAVGHAFAAYDVLYNVAFAAGAVVALGLVGALSDSVVMAAIAAAYIGAGVVWMITVGRAAAANGEPTR
jgi:hypothetical protein